VGDSLSNLAVDLRALAGGCARSGPGGPPAQAGGGSAAVRSAAVEGITTTGQRAWSTTAWLTDPSSRLENPPRAPGADDQQVGIGRQLDQGLGRVPVLNDRSVHVDPAGGLAHLADRPSSRSSA
jgi:hypothetical protein